MKPEFKNHRRIKHAELRDLEEGEDKQSLTAQDISISAEDLKLSDEEFAWGKVARNPANHYDQWYLALDYVKENFEPI